MHSIIFFLWRAFQRNLINVCVWLMQQQYYYVAAHLETPFLPNVLVLEISGLMQALSRLCSGARIQSSQYDFGHCPVQANIHVKYSLQP